MSLFIMSACLLHEDKRFTCRNIRKITSSAHLKNKMNENNEHINIEYHALVLIPDPKRIGPKRRYWPEPVRRGARPL